MPRASPRGFATLRLRTAQAAVAATAPDLPAYGSPLLNLANYFARGTRPDIVGRMDEMAPACPAQDYAGWLAWYGAQRPGAIDAATEKVWAYVQGFRRCLESMGKDDVRAWVEELVLAKPWAGTQVQLVVLQEVARRTGLRPAWLETKPGLVAGDVDGYLGGHAVQVKPWSYKSKAKALAEAIPVPIVYYEKRRGGVRIDYSAVLPLVGTGERV